MHAERRSLVKEIFAAAIEREPMQRAEVNSLLKTDDIVSAEAATAVRSG